MESMGRKASVRFAALVKSLGKPELLSLWTNPAADKNFKKAVVANRVATLKQINVGTKKDFGTVGFEKVKRASFLLFPKEIPYASGTKIIGVKYDLMAKS
jgi:hypothetical protein